MCEYYKNVYGCGHTGKEILKDATGCRAGGKCPLSLGKVKARQQGRMTVCDRCPKFADDLIEYKDASRGKGHGVSGHGSSGHGSSGHGSSGHGSCRFGGGSSGAGGGSRGAGTGSRGGLFHRSDR
ncbi:hypothetical protein C8A05DRAFT_34409 [Staphylotrichum tortipilum]|uniref:Uncharacterized protein n=1 Tax=Staphylotrichum tortipilum TaxID=2831512 RepID=A0AAN6MJX6_9PEZI|nr:hypothetical protein C8A05DRAFT_34409 [Staphylotrichum longicolle]